MQRLNKTSFLTFKELSMVLLKGEKSREQYIQYNTFYIDSIFNFYLLMIHIVNTYL